MQFILIPTRCWLPVRIGMNSESESTYGGSLYVEIALDVSKSGDIPTTCLMLFDHFHLYELPIQTSKATSSTSYPAFSSLIANEKT